MYPGVHAANRPDHPAVIVAESGARLTYGELDERSARLANALRAAGLGRGDVVAVLTGNSVHAYEVYWAAVRSGMYLTAVNNHLTAAEAGYIIDDSGAAALVVSAALGDLVAELPELPGLRRRMAYDGSLDGYEDYESVLAAAPARHPADQPCGADLLYSSGTTGHPKGIRPELPDRQVHEPGNPLVELVREVYDFGPGTVYLSPAPFYHAAPLRYGASVHALGGTVVLMERFDAEAALRAIETYRITHSQWVPTMFVRMLKLDESARSRHDLSSHRVAIHAAAPCPVEVKHAMIEWWGEILYEYYAATEGFGMTLIDSAQWRAKPGSVGTAALGVVRICDRSGAELAPGSVGTVYFEREELSFCYLGDPAKTRSVLHPGNPNWATTGDLGYLDEDGYLFLTGRHGFMIISGGVNIYPQEIEDALVLHPDVLDVAVIGVPDEEMGESVKAVVQPDAGARPGAELERALREHVRERLAHYKAPQSVDFVECLPRTPTGKLLKGKLAERYTA